MRLRKTVLALALATLPIVTLGGPASAETGEQTFRLLFTGSFVPGASNAGSVIATGPVTGAGVGINSGFLVDEFGQFVGNNTLEFSEGTVFVDFQGHLTSFSFDPRRCITTITGEGTWQVADASDELEGTSGGGTFTNDVTLVSRPTRTGCSAQTTEISRITLTGEVDRP